MKQKHIYLLLLSFIVLTPGIAQMISKTQVDIGGTASDQLIKLQRAKDGGLIAAGYSNSNRSAQKKENSRGGYDYWIVKFLSNSFDSSVKIQWKKTIGGNADDYLTAAVSSSDGGLLLGGYSLSGKSAEKTGNNLGGYDYWLVKTNSNGDIEWDKTIGTGLDDYLNDVNQTSDKGYILAGTMGLTKIDINGNIQWQQTGTYKTAAQLKDGSYITTGRDDTGLFMRKTDNMGNIQWTKQFGWPYYIAGYGAAITKDGGFVFFKRGANSYSESGEYYYDFYIKIIKTDGLGNQQWIYDPYPAIPDLSQTAYCALKQTNDEGYIFSTSSSSANPDYYTIKINGSGQLQWTKTISGSRSEICTDLVEAGNGHYLIGGYSNSPVSSDKTKANLGDYDFWIVGLKDTTGNSIAVNNMAVASAITKKTKAIFVYPNPAKNILHIQNTGKAVFILTNQLGKIVATKSINGNGEINVAHLSAGLYYLKNTETGTVQKVMIAK